MSKAIEIDGEFDEGEDEVQESILIQEQIQKQEQKQSLNKIDSIDQLQKFILFSEKERVDKLLNQTEKYLEIQNKLFSDLEKTKQIEGLDYVKKIFDKTLSYTAKLRQIQEKQEYILKGLNELKQNKFQQNL